MNVQKQIENTRERFKTILSKFFKYFIKVFSINSYSKFYKCFCFSSFKKFAIPKFCLELFMLSMQASKNKYKVENLRSADFNN